MLEYVSPSGRWKKWSMPMSMLAGDGGEARGVLLSEGVMFDLKNRSGVLGYIAGQHPPQTMRAAKVTGWCGDAFVLPDQVIGADDIWFQAMGRTAPYGVAGTFEAWQSGVAALAQGNPLLMLAICAGLAGPLLVILNSDGAGLHFYGDSSTGKSTSLYAAISAWGTRHTSGHGVQRQTVWKWQARCIRTPCLRLMKSARSSRTICTTPLMRSSTVRANHAQPAM